MCEGVGRGKLDLPSCPFCVKVSKYKGSSLITSSGCDCVALLGK